jgi:hypothetical protein
MADSHRQKSPDNRISFLADLHRQKFPCCKTLDNRARTNGKERNERENMGKREEFGCLGVKLLQAVTWELSISPL